MKSGHTFRRRRDWSTDNQRMQRMKRNATFKARNPERDQETRRFRQRLKSAVKVMLYDIRARWISVLPLPWQPILRAVAAAPHPLMLRFQGFFSIYTVIRLRYWNFFGMLLGYYGDIIGRFLGDFLGDFWGDFWEIFGFLLVFWHSYE